MTVWILSIGELHEGGSVVGVFLTEARAREAAQQMSRQPPWEEEKHNIWYSACDFMQIEEHEVE